MYMYTKIFTLLDVLPRLQRIRVSPSGLMADQTQAPRRERVVPRVREWRAYDPRASSLVHHRPLVRGLRPFTFALALLASVPIMQPIQFPCNIRPSGSLLWTADDKFSSPGKGRAVKLRRVHVNMVDLGF